MLQAYQKKVIRSDLEIDTIVAVAEFVNSTLTCKVVSSQVKHQIEKDENPRRELIVIYN